jgi:hypothetical protein
VSNLWWYILAAALVVLAVGIVLMFVPKHDAGGFEAELDAAADPALPDPDLEADHDPAPTSVLAPLPAMPQEGMDRPGASVAEPEQATEVGAADTPLVPADPGRMTSRQRRRALHKGRIPRPTVAQEIMSDIFPGPAVIDLPGPVRSESDHRAGEHHERLPDPLRIYDPERRAWMPVFPSLVESIRHQAEYREWELWLGAQLVDFREWYEAPARWELAA